MGTTLHLQCPLCCDESFPSYEGLKYHLLSITDNLLCTACGLRFDDIPGLIRHLDFKCKEPETVREVPQPKTSLLAQALLNKDIGAVKSATKVKEPEEMYTSVEIQEEEENDDDEEELYHCSDCNMSFSAVDEHLYKYHAGQKVVVENGSESTERTVASKSVKESPEIVLKSEAISPESKRSRRYVILNGKPVEIKEDEGTEDNNATVVISPEDYETVEEIVMQQCSVCHLHFVDKTKFNDHICQQDGVAKAKTSAKKRKLQIIHCPECKSTFYTETALKKHMKVHMELEKMTAEEKDELNTCGVCNTTFGSTKSLRLHARMHDPIKLKEVDPPVNYGITGEITFQIEREKREQFECHVCSKNYDKEYEEVHMKSHQEDDSNFHCGVCNKKFESQSFLDMHMSVHVDSKRFSCSYCKKAYATVALLNTHMKTDCVDRPYECQYCGRRFTRPHEKVKHERIHTGEKPHVCDLCGKGFRVSYCLTLHMRTHSGSRPYQCPHCLKRFKAHSVYTHHLLTHSTERKYKCPFCPKAFKTSVQLAGHRNSHTKPFTCTQCNRPFASLYAVRVHMDTHRRQNNLKHNCDVCGASYARVFALRDHIKEQHPDHTTDGIEELPDDEEDSNSIQPEELETETDYLAIDVIEEDVDHKIPITEGGSDVKGLFIME